jgi:hypothetical protein
MAVHPSPDLGYSVLPAQFSKMDARMRPAVWGAPFPWNRAPTTSAVAVRRCGAQGSETIQAGGADDRGFTSPSRNSTNPLAGDVACNCYVRGL